MDNPQAKRLTRSTTDRVFGGVCGGLAEYLQVDPTIVRIIFVLVGVWQGWGVLVYFLLWWVIPENKPATGGDDRVQQVGSEMRQAAQRVAEQVRGNDGSTRGAMIVGGILVVIGLMALGKEFLPWKIFSWDFFWPLAIVAFGVALMFKRK